MWRCRPDSGCGRPWSLAFGDRVLLVVLGYRTKPPTDRRELWLADGTLIPVHDQRKTKKSKNYRRSVNVQIVCRAHDRRIVAVGDTWPGNRNDVVVFRETLGRTLPDHPRLSGDGGYQGIERIRSPRREPDRKIIKDRAYRRFRKRRAVAETSLRRAVITPGRSGAR
ncbi:transposase [Streptomyces sp. NPDC019937]|uniref:transposase n=1 Tax=Streptomyces sp. NPDC019937 TaxID=3154787 RepID=UPI0034006050